MLSLCWKKKILENDKSLILSISPYALIKDPFTNLYTMIKQKEIQIKPCLNYWRYLVNINYL